VRDHPAAGDLCLRARGGTEIATTGLTERRPVVEAVIQREVMEYRIVSGTCACGRAQRSTFPAGIEAPVQYGPSGSAFAVYMTQYQLLPYQCTAGVLNELAGLAISPGTLQRRRTGGRRPPGGASHCYSRHPRRGASGPCR